MRRSEMQQLLMKFQKMNGMACLHTCKANQHKNMCTQQMKMINAFITQHAQLAPHAQLGTTTTNTTTAGSSMHDNHTLCGVLVEAVHPESKGQPLVGNLLRSVHGHHPKSHVIASNSLVFQLNSFHLKFLRR